MTNSNQHYEKQAKLSVQVLLAELPNFIAMTFSAFLSNSLIVWLDFFDCLGNIVNTLFILVLSNKLKKNLKYAYNYGVGKIEAISSVICEAQYIIALLFMFACCIYQLFHPEQPSSLLGYVILLKLINLSFDTYFIVQQLKIMKKNKTAVTVSEYHKRLRATAFDVVATLSIFICWIFINNKASWYFSPIMCMLLDTYFIYEAIKRIKESIDVLTDKTLPEDQQMKILKVLNKYYDKYENCSSIDSRKNGEHVWIDLKMTFDKQTTYEEIKGILEGISKDMKEEIPDAKVAIKITNKQEEKEITEM